MFSSYDRSKQSRLLLTPVSGSGKSRPTKTPTVLKRFTVSKGEKIKKEWLIRDKLD